MSGKGSTPRPYSVSHDDFADSWERIFGKKEGQAIEQPESEENGSEREQT
jgi:hypothetical protein